MYHGHVRSYLWIGGEIMKNIAKIWAKNIIEGNKTFDDVPAKLKEYVKEWLIEWGKEEYIEE